MEGLANEQHSAGLSQKGLYGGKRFRPPGTGAFEFEKFFLPVRLEQNVLNRTNGR